MSHQSSHRLDESNKPMKEIIENQILFSCDMFFISANRIVPDHLLVVEKKTVSNITRHRFLFHICASVCWLHGALYLFHIWTLVCIEDGTIGWEAVGTRVGRMVQYGQRQHFRADAFRLLFAWCSADVHLAGCTVGVVHLYKHPGASPFPSRSTEASSIWRVFPSLS